MARDKAYREAEEQIQTAQHSGTTLLDLSVGLRRPNSDQLTELPESLGGLVQLRWLDLGGNRLTALPESLGGLARLAGAEPRRQPTDGAAGVAGRAGAVAGTAGPQRQRD